MGFIRLNDFPYFAFDTETTGLRYKIDEVFGFSIATPDGNSAYYDIRQQPKSVEWLNYEMSRYKGTIICHNCSFDYRMSEHTGIYLPMDQLDDTVIRACCIDEHLPSYDLDSLLRRYLNKRKDVDIYKKLAEIFGGNPTKRVQMKNLPRAPLHLVANYAEIDAEGAMQLWEWQNEEIRRQGLQDIIEFEKNKIPLFIKSEMRGIRVDMKYAERASDELTPLIEEKQKILNKMSGMDINVNSPPQVKSLFSPKKLKTGTWVASDGTPLKKTPKGQASLGAEALRTLTDPKAQLILDIRSLMKTRDTFIRGHVIGHSINGRVYPNINQSKSEKGGTGTGRLSYTNPAMQQIPSRNKKIASIVKPCFLPDVGMKWVDSDLASFEVRVFYHLIGNKDIIEAYKLEPNKDAHQFVADLTGLPRDATYAGQPNAKQLNLSMIFNQGDGATAEKMGMPWSWEEFKIQYGPDAGEIVRYKKAGKEAKRVIERYHRQVPGIRKLAEKCKSMADRDGFITTFTGRKIRFPQGQGSWFASGKLIQATAADLNKQNWQIIDEVLGNRGYLNLNTHDSYSMCLPRCWKKLFNEVKNEIEKPRIDIPLILELSGVGKNWWEAVKKG